MKSVEFFLWLYSLVKIYYVCLVLLMTGILRKCFIPDLTETAVSAVSNPSGHSISFVSKSIGILLLILPKLTLHWMLISLPAATMVVLAMLHTKNSSWSVDWVMRLTSSASIIFNVMFLTLLWSVLMREFSLLTLLTNILWHWILKLGYLVVLWWLERVLTTVQQLYCQIHPIT